MHIRALTWPKDPEVEASRDDDFRLTARATGRRIGWRRARGLAEGMIMKHRLEFAGSETIDVVSECTERPRATLAAVVFAVGVASAGCGTVDGGAADSSRSGVIAQAYSSSFAAAQSFDDTTLWNPTSGTIASSDVHVEGTHSLAVSGGGWRELWSAPVAAPPVLSSTVAYELRLPSEQPNPWWFGQTQLYVDAPSAGIWHEYLGSVELTGKPLGRFLTMSYAVPAWIRTALASHPVEDLRFSIVLNVPSDAPGTYHLDHLRFVRPGGACPDVDAGQFAPSALVGPEGGALCAHDGRVALEIPPGALASPAELTLTLTSSEAEYPDSGLLPDTLYEFGPDGLELLVPATLTVAYDPDEVPAGIDPSSLVILGSTVAPGEPQTALDPWREHSSTVDPSLATVTGTIRHFSYYGAGLSGETIELTPDPVTVEAGQAVTLEARVFDSTGLRLPRDVAWSTGGLEVAEVLGGEPGADAGGEAFATATLTGITRGTTQVRALLESRLDGAWTVNDVTVTSTSQPHRVLVAGTLELTPPNDSTSHRQTFYQGIDLSPSAPNGTFFSEIALTPTQPPEVGTDSAFVFGQVDLGTTGEALVSLFGWRYGVNTVVIEVCSVEGCQPRTDPVPLPLGETVSRGAAIGTTLYGSMSFTFALQHVPPAERWSPEAVCATWDDVRGNLVDGVWSGGNLSPVSGDESTCVAGDNPQSRSSILSLVNLYRDLAGVQAVGTDPALDAAAQGCAYMHYLHSPQTQLLCHNETSAGCPDFMTWLCSTPAARAAAGSAGSNLASPGDVDAIDRFMVDSVTSGLGHRLSMISSGLGDIGIGSTQGGPGPVDYLCMQQNARADGVPRRSWTAWPPPGPVPLELFELRSAGPTTQTLDEAGWSIQADGMIALASASLEPYASVSVVDETGATLQTTPVEALGQDALRFMPVGWETEAGKAYTVTWTPDSDRHQPPIRYTVTPIDCEL